MSDTEELSVRAKSRKKKRSQQKTVLFWSGECWYSVVKDTVQKMGWNSSVEESAQAKSNLFWIDRSKMLEFYEIMQPWQCINHFPGMPNVANKNKMGQNLNRMLKLFPKEYAFYPRTWILPNQMTDFRNQFDTHGNALDNKIYIIKPDTGCQGRGIFLTRTLDKIPLGENVVAQTYLGNPLLVDGFKFDLRIYVFVASVKPLRVYLFHDGLVRMCTEEYVKPNKQNIEMSCMHLTNYAVNKKNSNFQQPGDEEGDSGHKRSLQWFMDWIRAERGDAKADWLWKRMGVIIMRTLLSIMPVLSREYDQHFKSFNNVPVDRTKVGQAAERDGSSPLPGTSEDATAGNSESEAEKENESKRSATASPAGSNTSGSGTPQTRGSRCFEVLGYDVMIDDNLNPWIIEVNHLPR
jgi:tubulin polyglutamylase TTLL6/13